MHQLDKLNHLKNIIKQVPHERFDLDKWRTDSKTENVTFAQLLLSDADCCVMGWATADATFRRLNFMLFDGVPLYAPFRANTGEPFTYEELKTNVVYRGSEAVREFFGLNYEDVDHIIFESNYAFEDPIKDEIIDHINHVIDRVNIRPQDLDHLLSSSIVALDKEVREFTLNDDEVREISVVVDCFNKFFPDGAYLEFIATVNVPGDCDPLEYIAPPVPYRLGWGRSSCMTCIFNSPKIWSTISTYYPERAQLIAGYEQKFDCTISRSKIDVVSLSNRIEPFDIQDMEALVQSKIESYYLPVFTDNWTVPPGAFNKEGCGSL